MLSELSIIPLLLEASLPVKIVMGLLTVISIMSWAIILHRAFVHQNMNDVDVKFEYGFWSGGDIHALHEKLDDSRGLGGLPLIFYMGFSEYVRLRRRMNIDSSLVLENVRNVMRVNAAREREHLDEYLGTLATIASTAPYIGLLGTVAGVINAFSQLAHTQQSTLATVAPGIVEALVATAMGLFVAIPAVAGYNYFLNQTETIDSRHTNFIDEFISYLYRHENTKS